MEPWYRRFLSAMAHIQTSKWIVWICLLNGIAWVWMSYGLAVSGHDQIAEALAQTVVTEIIGVTLIYAAKACIENLSKNNGWPDTKPERPIPPDPPMMDDPDEENTYAESGD